MVETADIIVVGGGCIGASIALHLAERNAGKILLLEKKALASGASGKGIGIIRTHYTHPTLAQLAYRSLQLFHHFEERFGGYSSGFTRCGYYVLVAEPDVETLRTVVQTHQAMDINVDLVELEEVQASVPQLNLRDVAAVAYEPDSGYGSPPQTTLALAQRAMELGVEIRTQSPVLAIQLHPGGSVRGVMTSTGEVATNVVVDCVGPWAKQFTEQIGFAFPVKPVVEHVVAVERPIEFSDPHPVISDLVNLCYCRSDPGPYTRIGNSDPKYHPQFALQNADKFHGQYFPQMGEELYQKLTNRFPVLKKAQVSERYSGIWGITPDYQPILGCLSHTPGLYCAVGFSGHGYKLSPIVGDLMSQLILGESNAVDALKLFRFERFQENDLIRSPLSYSQAKGLR